MKKILLGLATILMVTVLAPFKTYAVDGFSVSTQDITLHPGESTTFSITASNSAGKINLLSSDANIASINSDNIFLDMDSEDITVKANNAGTATITVSASSNFATYDEEILEGQSYTITINVVEDSQTDDDTQDDDTIDDQNDTKTTETTANTPDTGSNSQTNSGSSQIILSSIIGAAFAILSFAVFCLYNRKKHANK